MEKERKENESEGQAGFVATPERCYNPVRRGALAQTPSFEQPSFFAPLQREVCEQIHCQNGTQTEDSQSPMAMCTMLEIVQTRRSLLQMVRRTLVCCLGSNLCASAPAEYTLLCRNRAHDLGMGTMARRSCIPTTMEPQTIEINVEKAEGSQAQAQRAGWQRPAACCADATDPRPLWTSDLDAITFRSSYGYATAAFFSEGNTTSEAFQACFKLNQSSSTRAFGRESGDFEELVSRLDTGAFRYQVNDRKGRESCSRTMEDSYEPRNRTRSSGEESARRHAGRQGATQSFLAGPSGKQCDPLEEPHGNLPDAAEEVRCCYQGSQEADQDRRKLSHRAEQEGGARGCISQIRSRSFEDAGPGRAE